MMWLPQLVKHTIGFERIIRRANLCKRVEYVEGSMSFREYYKTWVVGFGRRGTRSEVNIVSENLFHHFRKYRWYRMILED
jgi:hypothetical protein